MISDKRKLGIIAFVLLLAALAFVGCASADTIYVPTDYPAIQQAVDAASPGDTIIVRDGIYTENVDVDGGQDHLTIKSENGSDSTIVQAANPNGYFPHKYGTF